MSGSFVHSLVSTDIASGWTECIALAVRETSLVVALPKPARAWRARKDPFEEAWPTLLLWLEPEPDRTGAELLVRLESEQTGAYPDCPRLPYAGRLGHHHGWRWSCLP